MCKKITAQQQQIVTIVEMGDGVDCGGAGMLGLQMQGCGCCLLHSLTNPTCSRSLNIDFVWSFALPNSFTHTVCACASHQPHNRQQGCAEQPTQACKRAEPGSPALFDLSWPDHRPLVLTNSVLKAPQVTIPHARTITA